MAAPVVRVPVSGGSAGTTPQVRREPRRAVHGVLLLDKPRGLSSNDALQRARRALGAQKAGHTGTLDPLASGLLPICFGAATKFSQASLDADKRYRATLHLGVTTTTADGEGDVVQRRPVDASRARIDAVCRRFVGAFDQMPPMHSALKKDGKALYEYARAGIDVERAPRRVTVYAVTVVGLDGDQLTLDVHCTKGTYIRTLAADIGEGLGCGAYLSALRRTGSGPLEVADAIGLEALQALPQAARDARVLPPDVLLQALPAVHLSAEEAARFLTGLRRRVAMPDAPAVRVYGPEPGALPGNAGPTQVSWRPHGGPCRACPDLGGFLGSAHVTAGELIPDRLLSPTEVAALVCRRDPS
jgi:tRNA pseudouridine55 synthase